MTLFGDLETYCEVPIKNGTYVYAESSEVMLFAYALDDGPALCWDLTAGEPMPFDLSEALYHDDGPVVFQNSMFDRNVLRFSKNLRVPIPQVRWRDTMVQALAHSLPDALDKQCDILQIPVDLAKQKDSKPLIHLFCKPRPANSTIKRATRFTHPHEWAKFKTYAISDITSMRETHRKMPTWNYTGQELALWHLDQRINDRGFCVDLDLVQSAIKTVERAQKQLAGRANDITNGVITSATQRDQLLIHILAEYGIDLPDMQAATLERRISDADLPLELRELLAIRLQASTTSPTKYKALLKAVSPDGRMRGGLQFNGALRTGRWAGRTFQPHNLPRLNLEIIADWHKLPKSQVKEKQIHQYLDMAVESIKAGAADLVFDNVMAATSMVIRGAIVAPKGRKLCISDLSNIEGRDAAWLAGELWKLQAFRDFDNGIGPDLYKLAYAKAFRIDPSEVDKFMRQIGKVMELMLQYEGGVGAFLTGAATYGIDLEELAAIAYDIIPLDVRGEAENFLAWCIEEKRPTYGLPDRTFIVLDSLKRMWRRAHPAIVGQWKDLLDTVRLAIRQPGNTFPCRKFKIRRDGAWLRIGLPSGRALCYPHPRVDDDDKVSYMGVNQYTRKWQRVHTYGGKLFENCCQAVARDVMAWNMPMIESYGFEIVLTVHDEVITEAPDTDEFNAEILSHLLAAQQPWTEGLPLAAGGFETYRYRKD